MSDSDRAKPLDTLAGVVVRRFVRERMLELELERAPQDGGSRAATVLVYVASCSRVIDAEGIPRRPREGTSTWFADDRGWTLVSRGQRVRIDYESSLELPAPKTWRDETRMSDRVSAVDARLIQLLPGSVPRPAAR